jgi:hypothetical protein
MLKSKYLVNPSVPCLFLLYASVLLHRVSSNTGRSTRLLFGFVNSSTNVHQKGPDQYKPRIWAAKTTKRAPLGHCIRSVSRFGQDAAVICFHGKISMSHHEEPTGFKASYCYQMIACLRCNLSADVTHPRSMVVAFTV